MVFQISHFSLQYKHEYSCVVVINIHIYIYMYMYIYTYICIYIHIHVYRHILFSESFEFILSVKVEVREILHVLLPPHPGGSVVYGVPASHTSPNEKLEDHSSPFFFLLFSSSLVYYETIKRELKIRSRYECLCDETLHSGG